MVASAPQITLPKLHRGQMRVHDCAARFRVVQCGRRYGKTVLGEVEGCVTAIQGGPVGWFAPTYKYLLEPWRDFNRRLEPIIERSNAQEMRIDLTTGGHIDFWTLETPDPGRGRKYKRVIVDEAGIVRNLLPIWREAIRPTLTDLKGDALFLGTPKGRREFHQLFAKGEHWETQKGDDGWASFRGKTRDNPAIDPKEVDAAEKEYTSSGLRQIFMQEYEGVPADDGGNPFGMVAIAECVAPESNLMPVCYGVDLASSQDWTAVIGLDENGDTCRIDRWQGEWRATRERLIKIIGRTPACVDATGVGKPIVEDLQRVLPNIEGFVFSLPSKQELMAKLMDAIQQRSVRFPDGWLRSELEDFEYEYTKTGVRYSAPEGLHDDGVIALALAVRCRESAVRNVFRYSVA